MGNVIQRTRSAAAAAGWLACLLAAALVLPACTDPVATVQKDLELMHAQGRYSAAAAVLDDPRTKDTLSGKNQLLWWLDRGGVALALDDTPTTLDTLEKAESFMEVNRGPTTGDEVARWLINDTAAPYYGEPYEDIYVNVLKLAARLERGEVEGAATVEARRMAGKADVLRDRYLRSLEAVNARGRKEVQGFSAPAFPGGNGGAGPGTAPRTETSGGEFIESPLGLYLSAVTFMKSGDSDLQSVVARRLTTAINAQGSLVGPVRAESFTSLENARPEDVNAVFVAFSGRGPTKVARRFGPIPIYTYTIYFELPELEGGSAEADSARVVFEDASAPPLTLSLVEDLRSVARANHERQLPLIYARSFLRSSLKAAAVAVATEAARRWRGGKHDTQSVIEIAGIIGGLLFVSQTEKADLRCWTFLPGQAHVGTAKLPPGDHPVRIEYLRAGGVLYSTPSRTIHISDRPTDLSAVITHYWR